MNISAKTICYFFCLLFSLFYCRQQPDTLLKVVKGNYDELGVPCAYVSTKGDTIIPFGTYQYCYTDTFTNHAIVLTRENRCIAINRQQQELYEVYWFDNGPDPLRCNRFRVIKDEKIGYANKHGDIVIQPQYSCAEPFENYRARVTFSCRKIAEGEHTRMHSTAWFFIDTLGNKIESTNEKVSEQPHESN